MCSFHGVLKELTVCSWLEAHYGKGVLLKNKNKNKNYKNIFVGRTETWSSTWKNYIASSSSPSRAQQLLLCPPRTHSFPLLGEISKEGGGEAMWEGRKHSKWLVSHAEPPRYSGETAGLGMRGGPTASSAKCETCWQYKPLFSHTCLINITHLWGRLFLFFFLTGNCPSTPFTAFISCILVASCGRSLGALLFAHAEMKDVLNEAAHHLVLTGWTAWSVKKTIKREVWFS